MIKIVHLYSDIMNLYGEYGNVRILKDRLSECGVEAEITAHRYGEEIDLEGVSFIYAGAGTENKFFRALEDIMKYKSEIESYISRGGLGLFTGSAADLASKEITLGDKTFSGLGIFDAKTDVDPAVRFTGDVICSSSLFPQSVIGFINKSSNTTGNDGEALFKVDHQFMNLFIPDVDGFVKENFAVTHLVGPILVKNPPMLDFIVKKICEAEGKEFKEAESEEAMKAYETGLANLLGARNF